MSDAGCSATQGRVPGGVDRRARPILFQQQQQQFIIQQQQQQHSTTTTTHSSSFMMTNYSYSHYCSLLLWSMDIGRGQPARWGLCLTGRSLRGLIERARNQQTDGWVHALRGGASRRSLARADGIPPTPSTCVTHVETGAAGRSKSRWGSSTGEPFFPRGSILGL